MRKFTVLGAIVIAAMFALCAPQPAGAFISNQNGIATAAHATTNTIEVKRSLQKGTPAGLASRQKNGLARTRKATRSNLTALVSRGPSIAGQHHVLQDRIDLVLPTLS
jgi:hypothetical protein